MENILAEEKDKATNEDETKQFLAMAENGKKSRIEARIYQISNLLESNMVF